MNNRSNNILLSKESLALKDLRIKSGFSLLKTSNLMNLSFVLIHNMESGRDDVTSSYVDIFLDSLDLSREDWQHQLKINDEAYSLRKGCLEILNELNLFQLKKVDKFLKKFDIL